MNNEQASPNLNDVEIHNFSKGWSYDLENHAEKPEGYIDAWNGRLYSHDGTLAFTSIDGTKLVHINENVVKYNGFYSFKDEMICFAKGLFPANQGQTEPKEITEIVVNNFSLSSSLNEILGIPFSSNYNKYTVIIQVPIEDIDQDDFNQSLSEIGNTIEIDPTYNGLFQSLIYNPTNPIACNISSNEPPINNEFYNDAIMSFRIDDSGNLVSKILWSGWLNIPFDSIITTEGVEENNYYKRVYFSDYYNTSRVINLKDQSLSKRTSTDFDLKTNGVLLNPRIKSIEKNGQLKAMTVFYCMRLITENGQISDFSALSKAVKITVGENEEFKGGSIKEVTNKSVLVDCYIPDYKNFKEVLLVAIEFEADAVPTTIRLVGKKNVDAIVSFEHFGSEPEYLENITLSDIFKNSISWRYNSDYTTVNNKLVVSGLRNDPSYINSKNMAIDFSLSGFDEEGQTHSSLLNPNPELFNYINNDMNESFFYIERRLYRKIEVFGNFKMKLTNTVTGDYYEYVVNEVIFNYVDRKKQILDFLLETKLDLDFGNKFPNLNIVANGTNILFQPINPLLKTDFYNYNLEFSTSQVIIELDNDTENKTYSWPSSDFEKQNKLVYGGVSNGWFNGNGVKVTMRTVKENILSKNTDWMSGNTLPLRVKVPSLKRGFMKGEIYRIGIQWFKNGNRLFTTVLGDIKIPDIGQRKREIGLDGNVIYNAEKYSNWSVVGDEMYSERIELQFDVRINCQLSKEIDSYQIVYVERTENNRTILAQGISAPLERIVNFGGTDGDYSMGLKENMINKWMLPSCGVVYDQKGMTVYDVNPDSLLDEAHKRIVTNRKAFYFDSPEFAYGKISSNFISSTKVEFVETITSDHDRHNIIGGYNAATCGWGSDNPGSTCYFENGNETTNGPAPFGNRKFSQKIPGDLLSGEERARPFWVNVSVFSNRLKQRSYTGFSNVLAQEYKYEIDSSAEAQEGEILASYKLNDTFEYANHSMTLASPGWFYQINARSRNSDRFSLFRVHNICGGRKTVFIKTKNNYFTSDNIVQIPFIIKSKVNFGTSEGRFDSIKGHDAFIVSNLKRENQNSIYGGRTEFAYASNEYIPLSDVFPVIDNIISSQIFSVEGDTYCSLYIKNKTSYKNSLVPEEQGFHWSRESTKGNRKYQHNKMNAWCYAVVLESTVEPRLVNSEEFYLFGKAINFKYEELYNPAYLQQSDLRKSIPIPYNFKDDPNLNNVVAASDVKLNGDTIDAWTNFLPNEFYELDKNKGTAFNLVKENDKIYVVQELQTSELFIDQKNFITPDEGGEAIQIDQGSGSSISGHRIISNYGTAFRRAIIESPYGFMFFDELKTEIVKINEPLLVKNSLALELKKFFDANKVLGVEVYYDDEFKESNIRFHVENNGELGNNPDFVISYSEALKVFNGKIKYTNDIFFSFKNKIFAPYDGSSKIGELNRGNVLDFFDNVEDFKLKIISSPSYNETKIFKGLGVYVNLKSPGINTNFITSLGHNRFIPYSHHWYKIREGVHTFPSKNPDDYEDIRGEWCEIEMEFSKDDLGNEPIRVFSVINFFRKSYK